MPAGLLNTLDLLKGKDALGLVEETANPFPELFGLTRIGRDWVRVPSVGFAEPIAGTTYETLVTVEDPTVTFVDVGEGTASSKCRQELRVTQCFNINPRWGVPVLAAKRVPNKSIDVIMAEQARPHMRGAWRRMCKCFYYGRNATYGDTKGVPGLLDGYDATNMVVDAGGTTATRGSSAWLVCFGPEACGWVWGNNLQMDVSEIDIRETLDGSSNPYSRYHQELFALPGLRFLSQQHVVRIKKLTADSGKGLDDDKIASALAKFPVGIFPDALFCSRRSLAQLQTSRTATNATGTPAPIPVESHGVPILVTDSILDTEPLTL